MPISRENTRVIITVSKELKRKAEAQAEKEKRSFSNLVVTVLEKYIEETEYTP